VTGPNEPGEPPSDDWGFPEVDAASTRLPPEDVEDEPVYDTGSDAWWRAQAEAQRRAAAAEPAVPPTAPAEPEPEPPPEVVEPTVLNAPSPLDEGWVPPELPELRAPEPEPDPEPEPEPEPEPNAGAGEVDAGWDDTPHDEDAWDDATTAYAAEEPVAEEPPATEGADWFRGLVDTTDPVEPQRVGPARAVAGAGLALLGVLLAIGALLVFNGKDEPKGGPTVAFTPNGLGTTTSAPSDTPSARPSPTTETTTAPAVVPTTPAATSTEAPKVPVSVLNNSRISHLADRAAQRFRAGGWTVSTTGNYSGGTIAKTTVYFAPGQQASAERFATQFGIPRVAPRFRGIPVQGMTVIVTRDYQP
jgi:hypothetical protein